MARSSRVSIRGRGPLCDASALLNLVAATETAPSPLASICRAPIEFSRSAHSNERALGLALAQCIRQHRSDAHYYMAMDRATELAVSGSADSEPGFNSPRLLPVPSTWWETPAVTSCVLAASPESARAARHFTREVLLSWGYGDLIDEAETIIGELAVNAVQHGSRDAARTSWGNADPAAVRAPRGRGYPEAWARNYWANQGSGPMAAVRPDEDGASEILKLCLLRRVGELMLAVIDACDDAPPPRRPDCAR